MDALLPEPIQVAQQRIVAKAAIFRALAAQLWDDPHPPIPPNTGQPQGPRQTHNHDYDDGIVVGGFIPFLFRMSFYLSVVFLLMILSFVTYVGFYNAAMPEQAAAESLYFDYTQSAPLQPTTFFLSQSHYLLQQQKQQPTHRKDAAAASEEGNTEKEAIHAESEANADASSDAFAHSSGQESQSSYPNQHHGHQHEQFSRHQPSNQQHYYQPPPSVSFHPWASVDLFASHPVGCWDAYYTLETIPAAKTTHRLLKPGARYSFETQLHLPDSPANREQSSMFSVVVELWSSNNHTLLAISKRSTRFPYSTGWIDTLRKSFGILGYLLQAIPETKTITLTSFSHFVESRSFPLQHVVVKIVPGQPIAIWDNSYQQHPHSPHFMEQPPVEVIGGSLLIGKEYNAFQNLLREWFYTGALVGTTLFAAWYVLCFHLIRHLLGYDNNKQRRRASNYSAGSNDNEHEYEYGGGGGTYPYDGGGTEPPCDLDEDQYFEDMGGAAGMDNAGFYEEIPTTHGLAFPGGVPDAYADENDYFHHQHEQHGEREMDEDDEFWEAIPTEPKNNRSSHGKVEVESVDDSVTNRNDSGGSASGDDGDHHQHEKLKNDRRFSPQQQPAARFQDNYPERVSFHSSSSAGGAAAEEQQTASSSLRQRQQQRSEQEAGALSTEEKQPSNSTGQQSSDDDGGNGGEDDDDSGAGQQQQQEQQGWSRTNSSARRRHRKRQNKKRR